MICDRKGKVIDVNFFLNRLKIYLLNIEKNCKLIVGLKLKSVNLL